MDGRGQVSSPFPKPGRALKIILIAIAVLGILQAFATSWIPPMIQVFQALDCHIPAVLEGQVWRVFTSGFLTDGTQYSHLIFTLLGLYFLGTDLEKRWGMWRFVRFLAVSIVLGNVLVVVCDLVMPAGTPFHPGHVYGATAAITAIAIAWARENAEMQVRLFFFLPVKGKYLLWVSIGFCVLNLIYNTHIPEGVAAPFGGVLVGLLMAGSPSVVRKAYLRVKLAVLKRRRTGLRVDDILSPPRSGMKRPRPSNAPPLRIVQGGLDDVLRNRKPPKDKRYLN